MKLIPPLVNSRVVHGGESSIRPVGWRQGSLFRPRILWVAGLVVPLLLTSAGMGLTQTVDTTLWITNGPVNSIVPEGSTIYIGGSFTHVGPVTGGGVAIDASTGAAQQPYPKVAGTVRTVASDGSGGWYLGGAFTAVRGQPRNNLAHLDAGGHLTPWNPDANGEVDALVLSGGTVYVCGGFTSIGGKPRNEIAALDAATGGVSIWDPNPSGPPFGSSVDALAVDGGTVYAGGSFTSIGGQTRHFIAALDATTGAATAWDPNPDSYVDALVVVGGTIYVGGIFSSIGGQPRNKLAALDTATGEATAWNPNVSGGFNGPVVRALAESGGTVYVGGNFTHIGAATYNNLAAIDAATGAGTAWNPNPNFEVRALAVSGGTVYASGSFTNIGGQLRNHIAALDVTLGLATAWNPNANSDVLALAVSGGTVYAGGAFTSMGGQTRNRIAAIDATTGTATPWNPNANGDVRCVAVSGGIVYAGGYFTRIGGQTRNRIVAIDATTGAATAWNPNANGLSGPPAVDVLAVSGGTVYAGGNFTSIGGQTRNRIAALDAATGAATAWNPNANSEVFALVVSEGTVYAGGSFNTIGGQPRGRIAALDATTGAVAAWDPSADIDVYALAVSGGTVYAGGNFTMIGGQPRSGIAAIDAATGASTTWDPSPSPTGTNVLPYIFALAAGEGRVYVGGDFDRIGGQPRNHIAALELASGSATNWNPSAESNVYCLAVAGNTVYAGGNFTSIGGQPQSFFAAVSAEIPCSPTPMSFDLDPNVLNLQSMGHWVTGTLEPEPPASPSDIDIASIRLNGSVPVDASAPTSIGDADSDGRPDLTVKFDRAAVELAVSEGDSVPVTVSGKIGNGCFSATHVIRVVRGHVTAPAAGVVLQGGGTTEVRWDTPAGVQVQSVAVLISSDDGATWNLVAHELPNTGSYLWTVPGTATDQARVAVVLVESADQGGYEVAGVLGMSGRFAIASPLAVGGRSVGLSLSGSVPNPGKDLSVSFSLPDAKPARLVVYDVSGREISRREVGSLGAGRHVVTLGASWRLAPGIYLVHLIRGDRRLVARAVVVQ